MTALSVAAGQTKLKPEQQVLLTTQLLPWAARAGAQCTDLLSLYYEHHLDEDLNELRQRWRIITAPAFVEASICGSAPLTRRNVSALFRAQLHLYAYAGSVRITSFKLCCCTLPPGWWQHAL